mmetsp:Transcript_59148/g.127125  ORF Transcript_59148/g.127125 Transcript_59148/m.127125 type:complete len:204 (-) Transcript_59148:175-786(-)
MVCTCQISSTPSSCGHTTCNRCPSSERRGMLLGGDITRRTWPKRPFPVPISESLPLPLTAKTSPGASISSKASPARTIDTWWDNLALAARCGGNCGGNCLGASSLSSPQPPEGKRSKGMPPGPKRLVALPSESPLLQERSPALVLWLSPVPSGGQRGVGNSGKSGLLGLSMQDSAAVEPVPQSGRSKRVAVGAEEWASLTGAF